MCSQMLSMNDSGKGKLLRILVQRKQESCSVLSVSVLVWNRLNNAVLKVTCSRGSQGAGVRLSDFKDGPVS